MASSSSTGQTSWTTHKTCRLFADFRIASKCKYWLVLDSIRNTANIKIRMNTGFSSNHADFHVMQKKGLEPSLTRNWCLKPACLPFHHFCSHRKKASQKPTCLLVRGRGLEPPRINHTHLKRARLPVPPPSHTCFTVLRFLR